MIIAPRPLRESQRPDWSDTLAVTERLREASEELASMTDAVAKARQVREFAGDRRKRSLALACRDYMLPGSKTSHTAAETLGRASARYGEEFAAQAGQFEDAERIIASWEACKAKWESARSVLSSLKSIAGNV